MIRKLFGPEGFSLCIGNLAELTGTPVETIRFYEREGLLPAAQRSENNLRPHTAAHADWLASI
jgi:DNA-binding transcriptional MerR regulator